MAATELPAPSEFLLEHRQRIVDSASRGPVLDIACGHGRHARTCSAWGLPVVALDRNGEALRELALAENRAGAGVMCARCDLETGNGIPVRPGSCGTILVFRFLFRPLTPAIEAALAPGGLLLYETFTRGQLELAGGPRNPDFLLAPGELAQLFAGLEVLASDEGVWGSERPLALARLLARKPEA